MQAVEKKWTMITTSDAGRRDSEGNLRYERNLKKSRSMFVSRIYNSNKNTNLQYVYPWTVEYLENCRKYEKKEKCFGRKLMFTSWYLYDLEASLVLIF